jgi:hypothetical protein
MPQGVSPYWQVRLQHGPPARVEVRREGGRVTAVVLASVKPIVKGGLAAWLGAWALGEVVAVRFASAAAESALPFFGGFALLFLGGWTVMGLLAAHALLWCYEGTEELSSDGEDFTFRRQVRGLGRTRRFRRAAVRGPVIRYDGWVTSAAEVPPDAPVRLAFETRWSTYRVSASLRHADAQAVVAAFAGRSAGRASPWAGEARPPPLPSR